MHAIADALRGSAVTRERKLSVEFEQQLPELTTLAFRVAFSVLRHRQDAEDVAQEAVALTYQKLPSLRKRERLRPWLVRVAWRRALDYRRGGRRRKERELAASVPLSQSAEQIADDNRFREELFDAIETLPMKLRMTIVLCALEGYDTREVAALLQVPEGTVRSRLHLAPSPSGDTQMIVDRNDDLLGRIDREIMETLSVTPSPELLPCVRERLAHDTRRPPTNLRWIAVGLLSLGATLAVFLLRPHNEQPHDAVAASPQRAVVSAARPNSGDGVGIAVESQDITGLARRGASRGGGLVDQYAIRPSSDAAAIERFVAAIERGSIDVGSLVDPRSGDIPVADLSIMPLTIPPIALDQ